MNDAMYYKLQRQMDIAQWVYDNKMPSELGDDEEDEEEVDDCEEPPEPDEYQVERYYWNLYGG